MTLHQARGADAVLAAYDGLVSGNVDPSVGHVLSL
jgi:hypothetical protein